MPYIIDGNNLMGRKRSRIETLEMLSDFSKAVGAKVSVVFDGEPEQGYPEGSVFRSVKIFYSLRGLSADHRILRLISSSRNRRDFIIVTSDRALASSARALGARIINAADFISILKNSIAAKNSKEEDRKSCLNIELNEWLRYFGCEPHEADAEEF